MFVLFRNLNKVFLGSALTIFFILVFLFVKNGLGTGGRNFESRVKMCHQFALDYLQNMRKEPTYTPEKERLLIDIETEIFSLCQLELSEKAAGEYHPQALEKYNEN